MRWEYIATGLGLVAIGLTLMVALPPPWAPKMNPQLVQAGILGGLVLVLIGLGITIVGTWSGLPQGKLGPTFFLILGALFISTGGIWLYMRPSSTDDERKQISLLLECVPSPLPSIVPPEGYISLVGPHRFTDKGAIVFGGQHGVPGEKLTWPDDWNEKWLTTIVRCQLTNYSDVPIFNISLPITAIFKKIQEGDHPGNYSAIETINVSEGNLPITKINPGKDAPFVFYIYNQGRDVVQISFVKLPTYSLLGESSIKEAQLVQPNDFTRLVTLWPMRDPKEILDEENASTPK
jgi:hypothetical protein